MTDAIAIQPLQFLNATVRVPGSKSLTNRALMLAALAVGKTRLSGVLRADDTNHMVAALETLGLSLDKSKDGHSLNITGAGGHFPTEEAEIHVGNAGTAFRFLTASLCFAKGRFLLTGIPRMHERPIGQLVTPLRKLGAEIGYFGSEGYPPLMIKGNGGLQGGEITMSPTLSSQYISALLHVAPLMHDGLTIKFKGKVTSQPYVEMTLKLMRHFGAKASWSNPMDEIRIEPRAYSATTYLIEPDASNASYFLAAAAITPGGKCTIDGLGKNTLQGDAGFADVLHQMGADLIFGSDFITVMAPKEGRLRGIDIDLNDMPDMAQTLAAVAMFAEGPTAIRNVGNLRVKETDRMAALHTELTKLGADAVVSGDDLLITPPNPGQIKPARIATYDDHRMAMAFSVIGMGAPGVVIEDPACVDKTYPTFFDELARLGAIADDRSADEIAAHYAGHHDADDDEEIEHRPEDRSTRS